MPIGFGTHRKTREMRDIAVMLSARSLRCTTALDYWDQLVTIHYGLREGIAAHFREATIAETTFAWAGAPSFVTPATIALDNSILSMTGIAVSSTAFLYQPMAATNVADKLCSVSLGSSQTAGSYVGVRIDDGSVLNAATVALYCNAVSPTTWKVYSVNTVGGVTTTQTGSTLISPNGYVLRLNVIGTPWTAWGFYPVLHTNMGFGGWMWEPQTDLGAGALAWTPTRVGIVAYNANGAEITDVFLADWLDVGRS